MILRGEHRFTQSRLFDGLELVRDSDLLVIGTVCLIEAQALPDEFVATHQNIGSDFRLFA